MRWRDSRTGLLVAGCALGAAVPGIFAVAGVKNVWLLASTAGVAAVVMALSVVWQERYKRQAQRWDEHALKIMGGCLVLGSGNVPTVAQITDPRRWGIHPSIPPTPHSNSVSSANGEATSVGDVPPYVPRDRDEEVRERIAAGGFVLLVGYSTAGKSRTACEAVSAALADHDLVIPENRDALVAAVEHCVRTRRAVLWLNDLERFLGTGGLTTTQINRIVSEPRAHRVIVATLRANEETRLLQETASSDETSRISEYKAREVLEQAHRVFLDRLFSASERERAQTRVWDARIAAALDHAEYGVAEYLAAGPDLQRAWETGWEAGANPRGAALVAAAVDCRRVGYLSPIPAALLETLHDRYLAEHGGARLQPESLDEAWSWATTRRRATTALLDETADPDHGRRVDVFDYLVDLTQAYLGPTDRIPDEIIHTVLRHAQPADLDSIGDRMYAQGRYHLALQAFQHAAGYRKTLGSEHPDALTSRSNLAALRGELGQWKEAEAELRAVLDIRRRVLGEEHLSTLSTRNNLAVVLENLGRFADAECEHRKIVGVLLRLLGEQHPHTLTSRSNFASAIRKSGRLGEAEAEERAILKIRRRVLGEVHPDTLSSRAHLALVLWGLGRLEEAEAEHSAVLEIGLGVLGEEHPDTLVIRSNLALVRRDMGRLGDAEAENRAVLEIRQRLLGEEHPDTLVSRSNLASVFGIWAG